MSRTKKDQTRARGGVSGKKTQTGAPQVFDNTDKEPQKTDTAFKAETTQKKAAVPETEVTTKQKTAAPEKEIAVGNGRIAPVRIFAKIYKKSVTNRKNAEKVKKPAAFDYNSDTEQPDTGLLQNAKERVLSANPAFVKAIAVVPILGAAVSLKSGVMLSGVMFLTVVLLNLVMYPFYRIIPRGYRFAASFVAAGAVITPVYMLADYLAPTAASLCGIYLPLIAVCALPMIEKKHYGKKLGIAKTALDAALDGVGFAFAAVAFSIIREIIGNGTLYDRPLPYGAGMKFPFALLPAGAFLLFGLSVALFRKIYGTHDNSGEGSK